MFLSLSILPFSGMSGNLYRVHEELTIFAELCRWIPRPFLVFHEMNIDTLAMMQGYFPDPHLTTLNL